MPPIPSGPPATRIAMGPAPGLYSDHMITELLAMHEEMVAQLLVERLGVTGTADFLTGLIAQHQKAAAMLRTLLSNHVVVDGAAITDDLRSMPAPPVPWEFHHRKPGVNRVAAPV